MNELGNKYADAALRERRAAMAGEIQELERKLAYLRGAIVHMDGTLKIFDEGYDATTAPTKRPYRRTKLFGQGKLNRMILEELRAAGRPIKTLELVDMLCTRLGYGPEAAKGMQGRVRSALLYLWKVRGLIGKDGERATAVWAAGAMR